MPSKPSSRRRSASMPPQRGRSRASDDRKRGAASPAAAPAPAPKGPVFAHGIKMAALQHPHSKKPSMASAASSPSASVSASASAPVSILAMDDDSERFVRGRQPVQPAAVKAERSKKATDQLFGLKEVDRKRKAPTAETAASKRKKSSHAAAGLAYASSRSSSHSSSQSRSPSSESSSSHVEMLTFRHLYVGQTLLGCVLRIEELELRVALPNGHIGHLPMRAVSEPFQRAVDTFIDAEPEASPHASRKRQRGSALPELQSLFYVGQLLPVSVLSLSTPTGSKRIELSMQLQHVNAHLTTAALQTGVRLLCSVRSVEEKGYRMQLGLSDANMEAFLPFDEAPVAAINRGQEETKEEKQRREDDEDEDEEDHEEEERLVVGQPVLCLIRSLRTRAVTLTANPAALRSQLSSASPSQHLQSLLPSSLYSLTVTAVTATGLLCSTPTFTASVDLSHLPAVPAASATASLSLQYRVGSSITGCLLYHNRATKVCACSLRPELLRGRSAAFDGRIGEWCRAAVWRVEPKIGVYFHCSRMDRDAAAALFASSSPPPALPAASASDIYTAFAPLSRLSDAAIPNLSKRFPLSSLHLARVTSFDPLSSVAHLTLQPSALSATVLSLDDVQPGMLVSGSVTALEEWGLLLQLSAHVRALVPPLHYADIPLSNVRKVFRLEQKLQARVLTVDHRRRHVILTLKRTLIHSPHPAVLSYQSVFPASLFHGWVSAVGSFGLVVEAFDHVKGLVSMKRLIRDGFVQPTAAQEEQQGDEEQQVAAQWKKGDVLCVRVLSVQPEKRKLYLSLKLTAERTERKASDNREREERRQKRREEAARAEEEKQLRVGALVNGRVTRAVPGSGLIVALPGGLTGRVHVCDVSDDWLQWLAVEHKPGERVKLRVIAMKEAEGDKQQIDLSMKASALQQPEQPVVEKRLSEFAVDSVVRGIVKHTDSKGCFVWLTRDIVGRVLIKDLSDRHLAFPAESFPAGKLVTARVLGVDEASAHVSLSLRPSVVRPRPLLPFSFFNVGMKAKAEVRGVKPFGVFVRLQRSRVDALAHISECSDERVDDLSSFYKPGDRLRCVVLKRDEEQQKVWVGLKARYFQDETEEEKQAAMLSEDEDEETEADAGSSAEQKAAGASAQLSEEKGGMDVDDAANGNETEEAEEGQQEDEEEEAEEQSVAQLSSLSTAGAGLHSASNGHLNGSAKSETKRTGTAATVDEDEDDFDSATPLCIDLPARSAPPASAAEAGAAHTDAAGSAATDSASLSRRAKAAAKRDALLQLEARELALLDPSHVPSSAADFERLLLSSPNSSFLWTRYMAHHVGLQQVEEARRVGRRALELIDAREEGERLNVWVALVGLEAVHGSERAADELVKEAARRCDEEALLVELTLLFQSAAKHERALDAFVSLTRRYPHSSQHWLSYARFLFSQQRTDDGRALLPVALKRLRSLSEEVSLVEKFALLEFSSEQGELERGRTMLQSLLRQHPRRIDVWSVWLDAELKAVRRQAAGASLSAVRAVLETALALQWSSKKMSFLLKRSIEVEEELGDDKRLQAAKQRARDFVKARQGARQP